MSTGLGQLSQAIRKRGFKSIFFKNLRLLSLLILIPMFITVFITGFSFNAFTEKEFDLYAGKSISIIGDTINGMTDDCLRQMNYMLSDGDINLFLITDDSGYTFYNGNVIYKQIRVQLTTKEYLESIYIYSDARDKLVSNYGETESEKFFDLGWMEAYNASDVSSTFFYAFRNSVNSHLQEVRTLSFYRVLYHGEERKGVIVYNVNFDKFAQELSALRSEFDSGLCIADANGRVLQEVWGDSDDYLSASAKKYLIYNTPIKNVDLQFFSAVLPEVSRAGISSILTTMLLVILLGFLLVILLTVMASFHLYRPYKKILSALDSPTQLMEGKISVNSFEETHILQSIRHNANQLEERVALLKRAQAIALQSQINPHFLHNTLDTINWAAMRLTNGKNEASVMITKLAQMLRYSLDNIDNLVPLKDELNNVQTYLDLQGIRYKDKFTVNWEIDEKTKDCRVIKIMLQPLLENTIHHGIKPLEGKGVITISSAVEDLNGANILSICVKDNGVGMSEKTKAALNDSMRSNAIREKDNIGLVNVNQRIQIIFGEEYGVNVSDGDGVGTAVNIRLPFVT